MDTSKTVPDEYFLRLLSDRLQRPDCKANGWILDGFPHTAPQTGALQVRGAGAHRVPVVHLSLG